MMTSNNALVPDPDKQDDLASHFWQWPLLHVGLRMCGWDDGIVKYFLLGNPLVYWSSTFSLGLFGSILLFYLVRWQRGYEDLTQNDIDQIHYSGIYPVIGWFLHYLPFVAMARVTYVHHYYPALYFAILTAGFCTDWCTGRVEKMFGGKGKVFNAALFAAYYAGIVGLFWVFRAIVFGMEGSHTQWRHLKWLESWKMTD